MASRGSVRQTITGLVATGDGPSRGPRAGATAAIALLAPVAAFAVVAGLLLAAAGPSERMETVLWVLAFAVALPAGVVAADRQLRALGWVAPGVAAWAAALGILVLACAMALRSAAGATAAQHLAIALAGVLALAIPFALSRSATSRGLAGAAPPVLAPVVAVVALVALASRYAGDAFDAPEIVLTLLVADVVLLVAWVARRYSTPLTRVAVDVVAPIAIALAVMTAPDARDGGFVLIHHHDFFLGPVNDVLHGRTMLTDTFSQYGVGSIYALALAFKVVPLGYGGLILIVALATVAVYELTYATLRAAGTAPLLAAFGVSIAVMTNMSAPSVSYVFYPSIGALRFGLPYVLVAAAVFAARYPDRARPLRLLGLATLAAAAVWSFETAVYTGAVYAALAAVDAWGRPDADRRDGARAFLRSCAIGSAVAVAAIALLSLATLVAAGRAPDWNGYLDYIALYSGEGFGQLRVQWLSPGPLAGLAVFLSAAGLVRVARASLQPRPLLLALTGFTALAVSTFTYYLGRSHPSNLLHVMPPIVAMGTLWVALLSRSEPANGRRPALLGAVAVLTIGAAVAVGQLSRAHAMWPQTALGQVVAGDVGATKLRAAVAELWDRPVLDVRSRRAAAELARLQPGGAPVLVLTEPDLTTEILLRAGRRNVLPIANPTEDNLVDASRRRVSSAVRRIPAGALMLISDPQPAGTRTQLGAPRAFNGLQRLARARLQQRFTWSQVASAGDGLRVVRLRRRE